jgi:hypothetical protein
MPAIYTGNGLTRTAQHEVLPLITQHTPFWSGKTSPPPPPPRNTDVSSLGISSSLCLPRRLVFQQDCLNVSLFLLSKTICILTTFSNLNLPLTSIEYALGRLIVPSVVPTTQLVAFKGWFHTLFMLIFVQIYQCVNVSWVGLNSWDSYFSFIYMYFQLIFYSRTKRCKINK